MEYKYEDITPKMVFMHFIWRLLVLVLTYYKHHRLMAKQTFISNTSGDLEVQNKLLSNLILHESSLSGLDSAAFLLIAHMMKREREFWSLSLLIRALISSWGSHPHDLI